MSRFTEFAALRGRRFGILSCAVRDYLNEMEATMTKIIVSPAYGRDYKSKAEIVRDLLAGLDFILRPEGRYINLPQMPDRGTLNVRYKKDRAIVVLDLATLRRQK